MEKTEKNRNSSQAKLFFTFMTENPKRIRNNSHFAFLSEALSTLILFDSQFCFALETEQVTCNSLLGQGDGAGRGGGRSGVGGWNGQRGASGGAGSSSGGNGAGGGRDPHRGKDRNSNDDNDDEEEEEESEEDGDETSGGVSG